MQVMDPSGGQAEATNLVQLLHAAGADTEHCSEAWVANHYRWIVWKLACYERRLPQQLSGRMLNVPVVLDQLKYRCCIIGQAVSTTTGHCVHQMNTNMTVVPPWHSLAPLLESVMRSGAIQDWYVLYKARRMQCPGAQPCACAQVRAGVWGGAALGAEEGAGAGRARLARHDPVRCRGPAAQQHPARSVAC